MAELTYRKSGDYLIPDLMPDREGGAEGMPIGKYGMLRETFLMENHHGTYVSMLLTGRLTPHLREIDTQTREQVERMVAGLMEREGVDENLKACDQMAWVQAVNRLTAQAEEEILPETVYK